MASAIAQTATIDHSRAPHRRRRVALHEHDARRTARAEQEQQQVEEANDRESVAQRERYLLRGLAASGRRRRPPSASRSENVKAPLTTWVSAEVTFHPTV